MFRFKMGRACPIAAALAAGAMLTLSSTAAVMAEEDTTEKVEETAAAKDAEDGVITFSTDYPGVTVKAGDTANFSLYLTNTGTSEADVALSADELPDGWTGYFKNSSYEVSSVHVYAGQTKEDSPTLSYTLAVPDDAKDGDYTFALKAAGDDVDSETKLTVRVSSEEESVSDSTLTAKYAEQEGASGTKFTFDATLQNNGSASQTYALSSDAPEGWNVSFTPSGASTATTSVPVDAGSGTSISIAVDPAENVEAGDYKINVTAASPAETLKLPLTVTITGSYAVTFSTPTGNLSVSAYGGETTDVTLDVTNTGNIALQNLSLGGKGSTDWDITYDNDTIDSLEPGATQEVVADITPAENAIIGDYETDLTVSNDQVSETAALRVSVKNHTTWGVVAVIIVAALIAGLAAIIRKFGRR